MATVFEINKGINRSIVFKGVKAQYILYLAITVIVLLLLFMILYICGLNIYVILCIDIPLAIFAITTIQRISATYGEHGLSKRLAQRRLPGVITSQSRKVFISLNQRQHEKKNA